MRTFRIVHEFEGEPADFWALLLDLDYIRAFNATSDIEVEVLRWDHKDGRVERELRYRSQKPVPALLKMFMPEGISYVEQSVYDPARGRYEHRLEPRPLGARAALTGAITVEPSSPGRFKRIYDAAFDIRVPVIGPKLEREAVEGFTRNQDAGVELTQAWLKARREDRVERQVLA